MSKIETAYEWVPTPWDELRAGDKVMSLVGDHATLSHREGNAWRASSRTGWFYLYQDDKPFKVQKAYHHIAGIRVGDKFSAKNGNGDAFEIVKLGTPLREELSSVWADIIDPREDLTIRWIGDPREDLTIRWIGGPYKDTIGSNYSQHVREESSSWTRVPPVPILPPVTPPATPNVEAALQKALQDFRAFEERMGVEMAAKLAQIAELEEKNAALRKKAVFLEGKLHMEKSLTDYTRAVDRLLDGSVANLGENLQMMYRARREYNKATKGEP